MTVQSSMTEAGILTVVRSFLLSLLPEGTEVVRGEANRVPEPAGGDFLVFWPVGRLRLSTNVATYLDDPTTQAYQATLPMDTEAGSQIDAETGLPIMAEPITLYRPGKRNALQPTQMTVQVDVHGPASADNAQTIATLFRDDYACRLFRHGPTTDAEIGSTIETEAGGAVQAEPLDARPLYASEPRQVPFTNAEQQVEYRWSIDLVIQANIVITTPQQFMDRVTVGIIDVDSLYHP